MNLSRRPTWELKNIITALSLHSWHNTPAETKRLKAAKHEIQRRKKKKGAK